MSDLRVASRYAKSIIDLASEQNSLENLGADMKLFTSICNQNKDFLIFIKSPIISGVKKTSVLEALLKDKVSHLTLSFFKLVVKKHREVSLPHIAAEVNRQINVLNNIENVTVTTAFSIPVELKNEFSSMVTKFTGKKVELLEKVDSSILGGYILTIGDKQLDESIKTKLNKIKLKFSSNPYISKL